MANVYAIKNGNWSDTTVWNTGVLPASVDDIYTNSYNVNVDQNINIKSLRNSANTGITASGTFTFNTSGVVADISDNIYMNSTTTTQFILITASSGLLTINIPNGIIISPNTANANMIVYSGNCNLTFTCISAKGAIVSSNNLMTVLLKSSTGTLIFNGNVEGRPGGTGFIYGTLYLNSISNNIINGNIIGFNGGVGGANSNAIYILLGNLTITGNVTGALCIYSQTNGVINITSTVTGGTSAAIISVSGEINITGTIIGGTTNGNVGVQIAGTAALNHIGTCQASAFGSAIFCNAPTTSSVTCTGPFLRNGYIVAIASQTLRINSSYSPYFEFRKSDGTNVTYVDQSTSNFPTTSDVRSGVSYASGLYTGTAIIPSTSNVSKDIPVDNTVGTAPVITGQELLDFISTSSDPMAVRLRNVSTVTTTGQQIASY